MKINFRITSNLLERIHHDLSRPHPYAEERVGFILCGVGGLPGNDLLILGENYHPVSDEHYIDDIRYGAMMGSPAIRNECFVLIHVCIYTRFLESPTQSATWNNSIKS